MIEIQFKKHKARVLVNGRVTLEQDVSLDGTLEQVTEQTLALINHVSVVLQESVYRAWHQTRVEHARAQL